MVGMPGRSGGPRVGGGRPRKHQPYDEQAPTPDPTTTTIKKRISPLQYLSDALSDPAVPPARRDRIAIAMLGIVARQGGLGKKQLAELAAREIGGPGSDWYDPEFGNLLAFTGGSENPEAAKKAQAHRDKWDNLLKRVHERPLPKLPKTDWGTALDFDAAPYRAGQD